MRRGRFVRARARLGAQIALLPLLLAFAPPVFAQAAGAKVGEGCAPLPGQARCVAQEPAPDVAREWLLVVPRLLLALPRLVVRTAASIALIGADVEDAAHIATAADALFWNDKRTLGVLPAAYYESGIGPSIGARLIAKDTFGHGEALRARAGFGGLHEQFYDAALETDPDLARQHFGLRVAYALRDRYFYGVGNADTAPLSQVNPPIDALAPPSAVRSHYRENELQLRAVTDTRISQQLHLFVTELWRVRSPSTGTDTQGTPWADRVYTTSSLVGLGRTLVGAYTEARLQIDTRVRMRSDVPDEVAWSGLLMNVWSGAQMELKSVGHVFGRFGFELRPFIDLYRGNRVLSVRVRGATVVGPLDRIAFVDLPSLGGMMLLRGYELGRFHGRATLLTSLEYRFPVQESLAAYVFADLGRPYTDLSEINWASLAELRAGFGFGLDIFTSSETRLRSELATSIDGGLVVYLKLNTGNDEIYGYQ